MTISRRVFINRAAICALGTALPTLSYAGGGGASDRSKTRSTSRKSYSEMSAKELAKEEKRLTKALSETQETIEDLQRDIKRANRQYLKDKNRLDVLADKAEQESDRKEKKKLNREVKKSARELHNDKAFIADDILGLERREDDLVRLKADMKSVKKWIKYRQTTGS